MGREFQSYKMKRVTEINGADGCTTLSQYLVSLNHILTTAKMTHLMLCGFHHNTSN